MGGPLLVPRPKPSWVRISVSLFPQGFHSPLCSWLICDRGFLGTEGPIDGRRTELVILLSALQINVGHVKLKQHRAKWSLRVQWC